MEREGLAFGLVASSFGFWHQGIPTGKLFWINPKLFHEAVLCNLLEALLYHRTAVESCDEYLLDLTDYSYRYVTRLISKDIKYQEKNLTVDKLKSLSE